MGAHLLRRLDTVAFDLGMDRPEAIHTALLHWLEKEERKTAVRNRMLMMRAWPKTALLHEYPLRVGRRGPHFSGRSAGATLRG